MVIVGAGIGGPALGIALKRAGIESIVYEASDEPRDDAGAFLNLAPNGLAVLQALGLGQRLEGLGFQTIVWSFTTRPDARWRRCRSAA